MESSPKPVNPHKPLVGVVGVCAAGKSTLITGLTSLGVRTRHIAQEHSYVKDMWKRITNPDFLIFLDATHSTTIARRHLNWNEDEWAEEQRRLRHARGHADLLIETDNLTPEEVLSQVVIFLKKAGYFQE